jgi:hypothetical protein
LFFCSCFLPYALMFFVSDLPSWIHDFGVNPTPSRQASGKLF